MSLWALNGCRRALRAVIPFRARQLCFGLVAEITCQTNSRCSSSRWAESAIWTLVTIETTIGEWTKAASRAEMALRYVPSSSTITEGSIGTRYWAVCGIRTVLTDWAWRCGVISESFIPAVVPSRTRMTKADIGRTRHIVKCLQWAGSSCIIIRTVVPHCTSLRNRTSRATYLASWTCLTFGLGTSSPVWDNQARLALHKLMCPSRAVIADMTRLPNGFVGTIWCGRGAPNIAQVSRRTIICNNTKLAVMPNIAWFALVYIAQHGSIVICVCSIGADHWCMCTIRTVMTSGTRQGIRRVCRTEITLWADIT